jgi:hypothetical protein
MFVDKVLYRTKKEEVKESWMKLDNERLCDFVFY